MSSRSSVHTKKSGEAGLTMVDIVIYHELQTALMLTNSNGLDPTQLPNIVAWLSKMGGHPCMIE